MPAPRNQFELSQFSKEETNPTTPRRIKVYFHVITQGPDQYKDGHVSSEQIKKQMAKLNSAFENTAFQFDLADVQYEQNQQWFTMRLNSDEERAAKTKLNVNEKDVVNVYTAKIQLFEGWSIDPGQIQSDPFSGVVILFSTLPDGQNVPNNLGHALVHEVGHWLGLYHTFEHGCDDPGDDIPDTNPERHQAQGCFPGHTSCGPLPDPIDNFMDYADDDCVPKKFTDDQSVRMSQTFAAYRQGP